VSLLATLTWGRCARLVSSALAANGAREGKLLVVSRDRSPALAGLLAHRGRTVAVALEGDELAFDDDELTALVAVIRGEPPAEWQRLVRAGGTIVLIGPEPPAEMSRRALCAGLTELTATRAGRLTIVGGRVWKPRAPASS
jgi:hypothetical protein